MLVLTGCQTLQLDAPVRVDEDDWWTTGGSAAHNAVVAEDVTPPLELAWEYNALAAFGPGGPLVVDDAVLVANLQGEVHAVELERGKRLGNISFREAIASQPALSGNRIVVANAWGKRTLQAYDIQSARRLWHRDLVRVEAGLLPVGEAVLVADMEGTVRMVDQASGDDIWTHDDPDAVTVRAAPLLAGDLAVVAYEDGTVRAFDPADGTVVWETEVDAPVYSAPTAAGDMVYVPTTRGTLVALDAERGRIEWQFRTQNIEVRIAQPSVVRDMIVFGASDAMVRAISTEFGAPLWRIQLDAAVTAQPLITGLYVYVGTMQNELLALDLETGAEIWSAEVRGRIKSSMAVAGGGILVAHEPRFLSYFRPAEAEREAQ
ncbi:MAG: PQQ-binding-like beta-propeller repeat protein [Rhodothermales bacterium]|nr:PQQ-binding-like beta-propeller repeat protein [Rhodothermales bacterium]MBO6781445.1 PQQ-binding-like beta-propeller repeat protein [Rhodothermales bacterium]